MNGLDCFYSYSLIGLEMKVILNFYSWLPASVASKLDKKYHSIEIEEGTTVADLLFAQLKVPIDEVGLVVINGEVTRKDKRLKDGDRLTIIPVVSGG